MAFNVQTFKTRALTAVVFVVVMLGAILWNQWSFLALFSVVQFGCWTEYQKLVGLIDPAYRQQINPVHRYGVMLIGWGLVLYLTGAPFHIGGIRVALLGWSLFWIGLLAFVISEMLLNKNISPKLWAHSALGLCYISLSCGMMMRLYGNLDDRVFSGPAWTLPVVLIASIWINDTMAYIVGSFIGRTPLSPISPKKTWEGTAGGAILAVAVVTLAGHYWLDLPQKALLLISVTAAVTGTLGDLFESKLKRMAGVKDSGQIMPGHGGFLDRFDSLLVATTCVWIVFYFAY